MINIQMNQSNVSNLQFPRTASFNSNNNQLNEFSVNISRARSDTYHYRFNQQQIQQNLLHSVARSEDFNDLSFNRPNLSQVTFQFPNMPVNHMPLSNLSQEPLQNQRNQIFSPMRSSTIIQSNDSLISFSELEDKELILTRVRFWQIIYQLLSLNYFVLTVLSILETIIIYKNFEFYSDYTLLTIFQNGLHFILFQFQLVPIVSKFQEQLRSNAPGQLIFNPEQMDTLFRTHQCFVRRKKNIFEVNIWVWFAFFIIGFRKIGNHYIDNWFIYGQLSLGFLILGIAIFFISLCLIIIPIILLCSCYIDRQRRQTVQQVHLNPPFQFKNYQGNVSNQPCYICLEEYKEEDQIIELVCDAKHIFHTECIKAWTINHTSCPVCRQNL